MFHRSMLLLLSWVCLVQTVLMQTGLAQTGLADDPVYRTVPAELVQLRDGLGNVYQKLKAGQPVKVAYLGGSITAANGWRVQTLKWLKNEFPNSEVSEINAAIGGTGSDLGVFRVQRDALQHDPDLLFVEFAVNDGGASPARIWSAMEGIVRQTWAHNPETDICFVYTYRVGYEQNLRENNCPRAAGAMEMLAEHYGIPSINVALAVVQEEAEGKLVFQSAESPAKGILHFSTDGVHPLLEGHLLYTEVITQALTKLWEPTADKNAENAVASHAEKLAPPFVRNHWQSAKMVELTPEMLTGDWKPLPEDAGLSRSFSNRLGTLWEATEPGSKLSFRFKGSTAKLYDLLGPDGGQVTVTVDGKQQPKLIPRFDSYCTYHRLATLSLIENADPGQVHTVTIELHPEQPDRTPVAFRLKNPEEELKSPKYQGTRIRAGQILLLGDLLTE